MNTCDEVKFLDNVLINFEGDVFLSIFNESLSG
jgi:hypothetical protein